MATIAIPVEVGEKVWVVEHWGYTFEVECLRCNRTGKVELKNGNEMTCGVCQGRTVLWRDRPHKYRAESQTITGFDVHNKRGQMEIWVYTDRNHCFVRPENIYKSFLEARKAARSLNKKHGWPKSGYQRDIGERLDVYHGRKVSKAVRK